MRLLEFPVIDTIRKYMAHDKALTRRVHPLKCIPVGIVVGKVAQIQLLFDDTTNTFSTDSNFPEVAPNLKSHLNTLYVVDCCFFERIVRRMTCAMAQESYLNKILDERSENCKAKLMNVVSP